MKKEKTLKRRSVAIVAGFLAALGSVAGVAVGAEPARPVLTMEDAHRCAFRVVASSNGSTATQVGSGATIARLKNEWLGATNAHVVDGCGVFAMQYFGDGRPVCVDAKLVGKYYDSSRGLDFALLAASRSALDAYDPPIAPLAPPERARLDAASPILSVGCPEAREPQAWKGRVTGQFGEVRQFKPAPLQGQSGSGILQFSPEIGAYETRALVTYRTDPSALKDADFDAAEGGALEFALLYDALNVGERNGSGGGRSGSNGGNGGVPAPRSRTGAALVPCVATSPSGFGTALWRSSVAEETSRTNDLRNVNDATSTKPLLLYFRSDDCGACRGSTPVVEEFARKGWPVKILNIADAEGGRAWRAYGFQVVPAFAFIEVDAAGDWFATLDLWTGAGDVRRRIERNFAAFKSRDPTRPRPPSTRPTTQALPKFVPCVAAVGAEIDDEEKTETPSENDLANSLDEAEESAEAEPLDAAAAPFACVSLDISPVKSVLTAESLEVNDAASQSGGANAKRESEESAEAEPLDASAAPFACVSRDISSVKSVGTAETLDVNDAASLVAETVAAEAGNGPTLPVELAEARLPAVAVELGDEATSVGEYGPDFEPSTAAEALEAFASGWSPFRRGSGNAPEASGGAENDGGSTDSTTGLIGGAVERAAREKVEALAAELEKAARERIEAVAGELETAARTKAEALAAEVEEEARTTLDELSLAVGMSATALIGGVEQEATAKIATAVDGLKRRAGAALAAVGVWGAFAAGAWYWLVRGLAKC